jgi:hypothetical protein
MNWEALGAIGEIVGAVAVIATLGYLAVQIRQNTAQLVQNRNELRISFRHHQQRIAVDFNNMVFSNRDVGELLARARSDFESLDVADRHRWNAFLHSFFRTHEARHQFAEEGLGAMEEPVGLVYFLKVPSTRFFWRAARGLYESSFREYIDSLVSEIEASDDSPKPLKDEVST